MRKGANLRERVRSKQSAGGEERLRAGVNSALDALRESEAKFKSMVSNIPGAIYHSDDRKILYISDGIEHITGYPASDFIASRVRSYKSLVHPDDLAETYKVADELITRKKPFEIEYRIRHADGTFRWVLERGRGAYGEDGEVRWFDGAIFDITERKQAEEILQNLERFDLVTTAVIDGLYDWNILDGYLWHSPRFYRLLGHGEDRIVNTIAVWKSMIHPEDLAAVSKQLDDHLKEKTPFSVEYRFRTKGGEYRWIHEKGQAIWDEDGNPVRMVGSLHDITESKKAEEALRESEAKFKSMVANVPGTIYRAHAQRSGDDDFSTQFVSDAIERMTGYPASDFIGSKVRTLASVTDPDDVAMVWRAMEEGLAEKEPFTIEYRILHSNGSTRWVHERGQGVYDEEGRAQWIDGAIFDITERKEAETEFRQAQKMEAVGQLTGGVAHDFNNLLTVILGNLEMLDQDSKDDKRHRKWIQAASKASRRGADLTKRLLAFSRIQMLKPEVLSLNGLVSEMSELLHRTLGEAIEIETPLAADLWRAKVDRGQLENALLNLTINARDFMPRGGRLTIETANIRLGEEHAERYPDVAEGDYVMLAVTDSGLGMTREVAERAFDPFFTTKEAGKGSGLGLSMVYGFIKQSGGFTKIVSEPGRGTTVELYLPRVKPSEERAAPEQPRRDEKYPTGDEAILLVEDDEAVREMTAEVLQSLGYRVLSAPDGPSALGVLDTHREIDLLFTDMVMPGGMNGVDLAREMRARGARLKVLYASGYAIGALTAGGPLDPSDKFIGKPFTKADLAREVRHALSG